MPGTANQSSTRYHLQHSNQATIAKAVTGEASTSMNQQKPQFCLTSVSGMAPKSQNRMTSICDAATAAGATRLRNKFAPWMTVVFLCLLLAVPTDGMACHMNLAKPQAAEGQPAEQDQTAEKSNLLDVIGDTLRQTGSEQVQQDPDQASPAWSEKEIMAAQQFGSHLSIAEWLGPMAPVALSPFFGITCLSGMAMFGGSWISDTNPLLGSNSPLHNPAVFWTFMALTILTSVPRLTKVSKPFAQAVDQLEAWSGIITMLVLRVLLSSGESPEAGSEIVQLGLISVSIDVLLMIAATINILVINTVKFFFETLIWITPIPLLDALFEFLNKSTCAALMAIYAWSPLTATTINLTLFAVCFIAFGWIYRREVFLRSMLVDAARAWLWKQTLTTPITVFPDAAVEQLKKRSRCLLKPTETGWQLIQPRIFRTAIIIDIPTQEVVIHQGLFCNTLFINQPQIQLTFSRRFNDQIRQLADVLKARLQTASETKDPGRKTNQLRTELT